MEELNNVYSDLNGEIDPTIRDRFTTTRNLYFENQVMDLTLLMFNPVVRVAGIFGDAIKSNCI